MNPHPLPPADLDQARLPLFLDSGPWYRSHRLNQNPLYFGASAVNRFDDPDRVFGVCYVGNNPECAFIETFGHETGIRAVAAEDLQQRGLATVVPSREFRFVMLHGAGLAQLGADARLATGDYRIAQAWARALWHHPSRPDGLAYFSRHDTDASCFALFDRAEKLLAVQTSVSWADDSNKPLLGRILDRYDFG
ncbi:MAG TPA: RES family NAD+ phosphorylase, partial [Polyangia bacterium]|nr:RES family NAD+ phosphorylase [Polyangia bacterium]